jgi:hypothetical protein
LPRCAGRASIDAVPLDLPTIVRVAGVDGLTLCRRIEFDSPAR